MHKQVLPPDPVFSSPGLSADKVLSGVLHSLGQGGTQAVRGNVTWEALEWLVLGSRARSARCATIWIRLQQHYKGAEDASSDTVTAIDCYQAERENAQVQCKTGQAKQAHCSCVYDFGY